MDNNIRHDLHQTEVQYLITLHVYRKYIFNSDFKRNAFWRQALKNRLLATADKKD